MSGDGEEEEKDAGHQGDKSRAHSAGPPTGRGAAPRIKTGCLPSAGRASAVIMRLITSNDMPVSMLMPDKVRTNQ